MKSVFLKILVSTVLLVIFNKSEAQISIAPSASYLKSTGKNKAQLFGGGLAAGYVVTPNIQAGIAYNYYPAKNSTGTLAGNFKVAYKDETSNAMLTFTYLFNDSGSKFRPYTGLDAGVVFSKQRISLIDFYNGAINYSYKSNTIVGSSKAGLQYSVAKKLSLFVQAQYHFSVLEKKEKLVGYVATNGQPIVLLPVQQFFITALGINYKF